MIYCHLNFLMSLKYYYKLIIFIYMKNIYKLFYRMNFAGTIESDSDENGILLFALRVNSDHSRGSV